VSAYSFPGAVQSWQRCSLFFRAGVSRQQGGSLAGRKESVGFHPSAPGQLPIPCTAPRAGSGEGEQPGRAVAGASPSAKGAAGAWMGMLGS